MKLAARAPGKVNLCLFLGGPRTDGRHALVTLLESVSLADELELTTTSGDEPDVVVCPGVEGPNLAAGALAGLRARGWAAPPIRLEIRKRVPVAAGMGGGSADAAATLRLARSLFPLPPGVALQELAAALGADVPSQLAPGLTLGTGAGELVEPVAGVPAHAFVLLPLAVALPTTAVYHRADQLGLARSSGELEQLRAKLVAALAGPAPLPGELVAPPVGSAPLPGELVAPPRASLPGELVVNDLAPAALSLCPQIAEALTALREAGADEAIVCGSGPTVAGLYWDGDGSARLRAETAAEALAVRFPNAVVAMPADAAFGAPRRVR